MLANCPPMLTVRATARPRGGGCRGRQRLCAGGIVGLGADHLPRTAQWVQRAEHHCCQRLQGSEEPGGSHLQEAREGGQAGRVGVVGGARWDRRVEPPPTESGRTGASFEAALLGLQTPQASSAPTQGGGRPKAALNPVLQFESARPARPYSPGPAAAAAHDPIPQPPAPHPLSTASGPTRGPSLEQASANR